MSDAERVVWVRLLVAAYGHHELAEALAEIEAEYA